MTIETESVQVNKEDRVGEGEGRGSKRKSPSWQETEVVSQKYVTWNCGKCSSQMCVSSFPELSHSGKGPLVPRALASWDTEVQFSASLEAGNRHVKELRIWSIGVVSICSLTQGGLPKAAGWAAEARSFLGATGTVETAKCQLQAPQPGGLSNRDIVILKWLVLREIASSDGTLNKIQ